MPSATAFHPLKSSEKVPFAGSLSGIIQSSDLCSTERSRSKNTATPISARRTGAEASLLGHVRVVG